MNTRMTGGVLRPRVINTFSDEGNERMPNQVKVMAILKARPGKAERLAALLDSLVAPSRAESGNIRYDLWQNQADPNCFVLDELYTGNDAVAFHRTTPHFQNYLLKINDFAERTAIVLYPIKVS